MTYTPRPDIIYQELQQLRQLVQQLLTQSPLGYSSITEGSLRVASNEGLIVEGSAKVSGYLVVTGTLRGTGTLEWLGTINISGAQNVTGPTTFTGQLTVNGPWDLNGNGEITGNVRVLPGGRIQVGDMIIDPADGGSVTFPGGAKVQADPGGGIRMIDGTTRVYVGAGLAAMQMGGRSVAISASGIQLNGMDAIPSSLANGASPGCIWTDGSGEVYEVVAG
ncbi:MULTISPECIES: hypothetical protein [unclassified Microbacterium]|uniref:hypothetical protein n=1 Tax=unclassified Microbacterium TaxID=2609290 RepID=UPI000EA8F820|nr:MULTISPECIES: hypothetical protein [unclassified Microbacterium]MBT2485730.1 hypothetical protein [Microbacterium sp. ISL-108]RKN68498.1 hypothetical protein D7252_13505 [Microbacterium sp. CGR2]